MSKGSTDMISEMDDIGDEEFAAMFCKTSSYLLKPLKNAQREKVSLHRCLSLFMAFQSLGF